MMSKSILAATMIAMSALACSAQVEVKTPPAAKEEPPPPPVEVEEPAPEYITISDRIQFQIGNDVLLPASKSTLDEVAVVLKDNPHIASVEIEGHTDSTGMSQNNKLLSQRRAEAVRRYLVLQSIEDSRLVARGYGDENPIGDNGTFEGREENRRVEFRIIEQGSGKQAVLNSDE